MKTLTVTMKWNETAQKWFMDWNQKFIYDFFDCGTIQAAFEGLDKKETKKFEITIKPED